MILYRSFLILVRMSTLSGYLFAIYTFGLVLYKVAYPERLRAIMIPVLTKHHLETSLSTE